jgi:hypothetical protein
MFASPRPLFLLIAFGLLFVQQRAMSQNSPTSSRLSADELARMIISNESNAEASDQSQWMFTLEIQESGKGEVKQVVATRAGDIERLIFMKGHSLSAKEQQEEDQRLQALISNPRKLRELQKERAEDANRAQRLLKILPDAFTFS